MMARWYVEYQGVDIGPGEGIIPIGIVRCILWSPEKDGIVIVTSDLCGDRSIAVTRLHETLADAIASIGATP